MASSRGRPSGSRVKPWEDALRVVALRENDSDDKHLDGKLKTNLFRLALYLVELSLDLILVHDLSPAGAERTLVGVTIAIRRQRRQRFA